mmetsp:Transcript_39740/g.84961  ORF Transcript_39740/g.84961 Transcript_39740/m.84961 type:complete len:94 (+) Transcript_39740:506-787(+)
MTFQVVVEPGVFGAAGPSKALGIGVCGAATGRPKVDAAGFGVPGAAGPDKALGIGVSGAATGLPKVDAAGLGVPGAGPAKAPKFGVRGAAKPH